MFIVLKSGSRANPTPSQDIGHTPPAPPTAGHVVFDAVLKEKNMSKLEELRALYARKNEDGLIHVGLDIDLTAVKASGATAEDLATELLELNAAIEDGRVKPLSFGDANLVPAAETIQAAREAGIEPLIYDGTVTREEFELIASTRPFLTPGSTATNAQIWDQINKVLEQIKAGDYEIVELED